LKQKFTGREIYYEVNANKMKDIDKWLAQFRKIWETRFSQLDTVLAKLKQDKK
jgi:hypothetical protein